MVSKWVSTDHKATKSITVERDNQKEMENLTCVPGSQKKNSKRSNLHKEIIPQWQSALKWGLGEVQPGSTPSGHTAELPSPVLPRLTQCLPQVINQRFRPWFNSSHTSIHMDRVLLCVVLYMLYSNDRFITLRLPVKLLFCWTAKKKKIC